ncbi:uncharacterized protein ACHE_80604S [Aspergillus chevalieri]|uniref:Altered inheritance of mitochondria protein 9, mitochondrial n=1 Tax=Aspergillus chevalieri TaxID=182096 RepID=A0A7R7ZTI4_ASPCH|nr:uncharacterized protein ACHE_80604S [Aspergillus chevalieri]BCR92704.1 hypothetical protein ACHE_80604S [Aspergillus chevalieri]
MEACADRRLPELHRDGSDKEIPKEELFCYTKHRFLLAEHYVKFNLQELLTIAVSISEGATNCTRVTKTVDGCSNKAFVLIMHNGSEVWAKAPNPHAGLARYTMASEVATCDIICTLLKIPVPRVLALSSVPNNPVEAEYIVEEKAYGTRLDISFPEAGFGSASCRYGEQTHQHNLQ